MFDMNSVIETAGYAGIAGIIFAETGLFVGFFLPGDTLLFTAGVLASQGIFDIWVLAALTTGAAILGNAAGYWTGMKAGPLIFTRPDSFWFKHETRRPSGALLREIRGALGHRDALRPDRPHLRPDRRRRRAHAV